MGNIWNVDGEKMLCYCCIESHHCYFFPLFRVLSLKSKEAYWTNIIESVQIFEHLSSSSSRRNILKGVSVYRKGVSLYPFLDPNFQVTLFWVSIVLKRCLKYPKLTLCTLLKKGTESRIRVLGIENMSISPLKTANSSKKML